MDTIVQVVVLLRHGHALRTIVFDSTKQDIQLKSRTDKHVPEDCILLNFVHFLGLILVLMFLLLFYTLHCFPLYHSPCHLFY